MSEHPYAILLVEDSQTQAMRLRGLFEGEGWAVEHALTGDAALEVLNARTPDLIIVDYYLPGVRGDEFCRTVRQNVSTRGIPILMLTSDPAEETELRGLQSGADDYANKSMDIEVLLLRIRALLRKSVAQRAVLMGDAHFRRARLLAIDDSPTYLEFLAVELGSEGYQVEKTLDPMEGLGRAATESFDCVLVDLVMPMLGGVEVCRRLTTIRRRMDTPIVVLMLTAHESKEEMTRGLEAGADDFVGKSADIAVLKARIRALLRRKFFQEDNQRIAAELKMKELEAVRARAAKEAAEIRAALAEKLAEANRELEEANRKLKEAQVHLVHSEKMASLGQLVAGIAHEINNPLAFVVNNLFTVEKYLAAMEGEVASLPPETVSRFGKARTRLSEMQHGLERVKELVANLRTFSRLDEGEFGTIDVVQSIDSVLMFLRHRLEDRIQVIKEYGPEHMLSCYSGQLNQVILNLLANATEAIETSGTITVVTRGEKGFFVIEVRDTGKGIPENIRHRVFDPFFTTKSVGQGTGLGLSISYGIVERHKGRIEVESEPGKGSTFTVKIPLDLRP